AVPPAPIARDAPTTVAVIEFVLWAWTITSPALVVIELPVMKASVLPRMELRANAPAPATATPAGLPHAAANDAATATALIVGRETTYVVVLPETTFVIRKVSVPDVSCQTWPGTTFVSAGA